MLISILADNPYINSCKISSPHYVCNLWKCFPHIFTVEIFFPLYLQKVKMFSTYICIQWWVCSVYCEGFFAPWHLTCDSYSCEKQPRKSLSIKRGGENAFQKNVRLSSKALQNWPLTIGVKLASSEKVMQNYPRALKRSVWLQPILCILWKECQTVQKMKKTTSEM